VLDTAGLYDIATAWHNKQRQNGARFLIDRVQEGTDTENELFIALIRSVAVLDAASIPNSCQIKVRVLPQSKSARFASGSAHRRKTVVSKFHCADEAF
jgi:hypothetical protein